MLRRAVTGFVRPGGTGVRSIVTHNYSNETSKTPGREHLLDDSRRGYDHLEKFGQPFDAYHASRDPLTGKDPNYKHPTLVNERGRTWVQGMDIQGANVARHFPTLDQQDIPFTPRRKMFVWGNYSLAMKVEFLFFYVPALLILALILPVFTMTFAFDEAVYTTMTVKVLGRQWYWIYDVESPTDDEDEDEDE